MDKYEIMEGLRDLFENDQKCSENCFNCEFEKQCNMLEPMLEQLFGGKS